MKDKTSEAYKEILKVLRKHEDIIVFNVADLEDKANNHMLGVELREKHGFDINPTRIASVDWVRLKDEVSIGRYGAKHNRSISWSDDGTQPNDELLLSVYFPTGAYFFGKDYPTNIFEQFFLELKSYNPKYTDTHNSSLYFSMDNAGKIYNDYDSIIKKYTDKNKADTRKRKIVEMENELKKLKGN